MPFKVHLIIVSIIIIAVYFAWQVMNYASIPTAASSSSTQYSISITHASWGLNCRNLTAASHDAFTTAKPENSKLRPDNVFASISRLCNGQQQCDIPFDETTLGEDPAPDCNGKTLEIEYRCFSYDRPWNISVSSGPLTLKCEPPAK